MKKFLSILFAAVAACAVFMLSGCAPDVKGQTYDYTGCDVRVSGGVGDSAQQKLSEYVKGIYAVTPSMAFGEDGAVKMGFTTLYYTQSESTLLIYSSAEKEKDDRIYSCTVSNSGIDAVEKLANEKIAAMLAALVLSGDLDADQAGGVKVEVTMHFVLQQEESANR